MDYYCIMVKTGCEEAFKKRAVQALGLQFPSVKFFFFNRTLKSNKGVYFERPMFPGYVFFGIDEFTPEFFVILRRLKDFYRVLRDNANPIKFTGHALRELQLFMHNGEHWGVSKVKILPGMKVQAVSGPFVGLEGLVYKINRKKKQITILSSLTGEGKKIDLLYEDAQVIGGE